MGENPPNFNIGDKCEFSIMCNPAG